MEDPMETTPKSHLLDRREECLLRYDNVTLYNGSYCDAVWDNFYCWPPSPVAQVISRPCKVVFARTTINWISGKEGYAYRICGEDGKWLWGNWTNFSECLALVKTEKFPGQMTVGYISFSGSLLSLILLGITLFIFTYFKSLHCSRLRVHTNLVVALIIHSILLMTLTLPVIFHPQLPSYDKTDWFCKTLLTLKMYAATASVNWMFVEGLLLYSSITVSVFQKEPPFKLYYFIGWGAPGIFVLSWAIAMVFHLDKSCWRGYGKLPYIWIVTGPMITALLINTIFLINIVRILVTKIRATVSIETKQVRKAVKATVLLFPLLGITHLLFCINPQDDGYLEQAYMITNALLQSCQGIFVSVLYCFLNSEVQSVLKHTYIRATLRRHPNIRCQVAPQSSTTQISHIMDSYAVNNGLKPKKLSPYRQPLHANNARYSIHSEKSMMSVYPKADILQIAIPQS